MKVMIIKLQSNRFFAGFGKNYQTLSAYCACGACHFAYREEIELITAKLLQLGLSFEIERFNGCSCGEGDRHNEIGFNF